MLRSTRILFTLLILLFSIICNSQGNSISSNNTAQDIETFKKAKSFLDAGNFKEAEPLLKEVLAELETQNLKKDYTELLGLYAKSIMHQWRSDEALEIYEEMKAKAQSNGFNQLHADAIMALTVMYSFKQRTSEIEPLIKEGMSLKDLPLDDYSNFYMEYARVLADKNQKDSALYYIKKAYDIDYELKDSVSMVRTCHNMGLIYNQFEEFDKSLNSFLEGKTFLLSKDKRKHLTFDDDISNMMMKANNLSKAKYYGEQAVKSSRELNLESQLAKTLNNLGFIAELEGDYDKAINLYLESDSINKKPDNKLTTVLNAIGKYSCKLKKGYALNQNEINELTAYKKEDYRQVTKNQIELVLLDHFSKKNITYQDFYERYKPLQKDFEKQKKKFLQKSLYKIEYNFLTNIGEYKKANTALLNYYDFKNDLEEQKQKFAMLDLEAKYEKSLNVQQIEDLGQKTQTQSFRIKQQKNALIIGGVGLGIITLLSFFIFRLYRRVSSQNTVIKDALKDKDFLLREIHHRVKNNLQVISSLLSLQSRQIEDTNVQMAIKEGRSRVRSMALIHQNLYQNENLAGVNVAMYLKKLTNELFQTYNIDSDRIKLSMDIPEIELDVDTMVPFGLIINELVSNCLKHAFPDNKAGKINVTLKDMNDKLYLTVKDNGIGINPDVLNSSKSFGNKLLKAFTNKLNGTMEIVNDSGTEVNLVINNYKKAA